jgi:hypothetical protein
MTGESALELLSKVPLSNNTISRRIQHIAEDINELNELKDEGGCAQFDSTISEKVLQITGSSIPQIIIIS